MLKIAIVMALPNNSYVMYELRVLSYCAFNVLYTISKSYTNFLMNEYSNT